MITPEIDNSTIILILSSLVFLLALWSIRLELRLRKLTRGGAVPSIEDSMNSIEKELVDHKNFRKEVEKYLALVEKRLRRSIQGINVNNFNAFKGLESGGQSFAIALINEQGDGIILSSLSARDRFSVFSKPITKFTSSIPLTDEETQALTKAKEYFSV